MVDAADLKSASRKAVPVRVRPRALSLGRLARPCNASVTLFQYCIQLATRWVASRPVIIIRAVRFGGIALATLFADDTLQVACPACDHPTTLSVDWLRTNRHYACENCGSDLEIDGDELLERLSDVDRAVDNLKASIDRLKKML